MRDRSARILPIALLLAVTSSAGTAVARLQQSQPPTQSAPAQEPPTPPARSEVEINAETIQARVTELQQLNQEDPVVKTELELLQQAQASLQEAAAERQRAAEFEEAARTAPERLKEIQAEMAVPIEQSIPAVPEGSTLDDLAGQLQSAQAQLDAARKVRTDLEKEFNDRAARLASIPDLIAQVTTSLTQVEESLKAASAPDESPRLTEARRWNLQARRNALLARQTRLNQESRSYNARSDLLRARRDRAQRQVVIAERIVQQLQEKVDAKRKSEAERARLEAQRARRAAANAHPLVKEIIDRRAELAETNENITAKIQRYTEKKNERTRDIEKWRGAFEDMRQKEEGVGLNDTLGLRLRTQRVQLPESRTLNAEQRIIREELLLAQDGYFDLDDTGIVDIGEEVERRIDDAEPSIPPDESEAVREAAREEMAKQMAMRDTLLGTYESYQAVLSDLAQELQVLEALTDEYRTYIDERVLWIQSSAPLSLDDLAVLPAAIQYLLSPSNWLTLVERLGRDLRRHWFPHGLFLLAFGGLMAMRRRMKAKLRDSARDISRVTTDRFALTLTALGLTVLLALPAPLLCWFLSWRLLPLASESDFIAANASALGRLAFILLSIEFLRLLCRPGGLADAHFRWRDSSLRLTRRHLRWFVPVALPLGYIVLVMTQVSEEAYRHSLGRLAFIAVLLIFAFFVQRMLHPDRGVLASMIAQHKGGWIDRLRYVWYPLLILAPLGFAVATAFGYKYTALQLFRRLNDSVVLILGLIVVYAMMLRWLQVAQRRMALEQARKKRAALARAKAEAEAAERARSGERPSDAAPTEPLPPLEVSEIDVAAVSAQTRRLLQSVLGFTGVLGVIAVWAAVLPALGVLGEIGIGGLTTTEMVNGTLTTVNVTLENLALALIVLIATYIVSRNIPGLLEIVVLQRLPISHGARYAITTLVRYTLVIIGVVLGFEQIGIGWAKVQWLAAAITVGLGFGLQEIFANFVSGIIILFERPIRVGDVVTVGEISGTVSRIRMRATTITDWDRKELIIPNREFVTGQIINWSLSDAILRVRIPVGIAYGSDTEKAKRLLLECARDNDRVLDDPEPQAVFWAFGASSLDFELRVFIPSIEHFIAVRNELNDAIDQAFRKNNVEIAFPQRDLHIRSIHRALEVVDHRAAREIPAEEAATYEAPS